MQTDQTIKLEWVIGRAIGERAKSIIEHGNAGIGYFIMDSGKQGNSTTCMYAFRRPVDSPIPEHLTIVKDFVQSRKLQDRYDERHNIHKKTNTVTPVSSDTIKNVRDIFETNKRLRDVTGELIDNEA